MTPPSPFAPLHARPSEPPPSLRAPRLGLGRRTVPLGLAAGALGATLLGLAARASTATAYMPVSELKPGMKGYGLTVFSGTKPERFDVEIISTLHNFRPNQDLVLIKTIHPRLAIARTVAGMSGSPIFVDGRMVGAYAYGWYFGAEPIAGVTPIESMLSELKRSMPPSLAPRAAGAPLPGAAPARRTGLEPSEANRFAGSLLDYTLERHARQIAERTAPTLAAPGGTGLGPASTQLMVGGLSAGAVRAAEQLLGPIGLEIVQAGGGAGTTAAKAGGPAQFEEGGVLAVELVRGDVSVSGLGTVTHVVGDKVLGFGHPLLGGGFEDLPTATGVVHWVMATQNRSFKIGEPTQPLGSLFNDRQSAVVIDTKRQAPTFPVTVEVSGVPGAPHPLWTMQVAHDPFMAPNFAALAIGSALEATASERMDSTWRARTQIEVAGRGSIEVTDFGSGADRPIGAGEMMRSQMADALGMLLSNPWQPLEIKSVKTKLALTYEREVMRLRGAQVLEPEIDAGQPARIRLTLQHYRGDTETKVVEVPIPAEMAKQTVEIRIQPGYEVERIWPAPENVSDLMAMLPKLHYDAESIVASYRLSDAAASYRGNVAQRLPPGAADTLRATSQSLAPEVFAAVKVVAFPVRGFVTGQDMVRVQVREVLR
jgi:hypothetical protein